MAVLGLKPHVWAVSTPCFIMFLFYPTFIKSSIRIHSSPKPEISTHKKYQSSSHTPQKYLNPGDHPPTSMPMISVPPQEEAVAVASAALQLPPRARGAPVRHGKEVLFRRGGWGRCWVYGGFHKGRTHKWMVYKGKSYYNVYFRENPIYKCCFFVWKSRIYGGLIVVNDD